jgi:hypothetical protein
MMRAIALVVVLSPTNYSPRPPLLENGVEIKSSTLTEEDFLTGNQVAGIP